MDTSIPNPEAAMTYARAIRDLSRLLDGAVETNDFVLLLITMSVLDDYTNPQNAKGDMVMTALANVSVEGLNDLLGTDTSRYEETFERIDTDLRLGLLRSVVGRVPEDVMPAGLAAQIEGLLGDA